MSEAPPEETAKTEPSEDESETKEDNVPAVAAGAVGVVAGGALGAAAMSPDEFANEHFSQARPFPEKNQMYPWAMANTDVRNYVRPEPRVIEGPFTIADLEVIPVPVVHATVETFGFRFNLPTGHALAYLSDVKEIPAASMELLQDLDVLAIDALRPKPHGTHMNIEEALATSARLKPAQTLLTHVTHDVDYPIANAGLPAGVAFACDGLNLRFEQNSPCAMVGFPSS